MRRWAAILAMVVAVVAGCSSPPKGTADARQACSLFNEFMDGGASAPTSILDDAHHAALVAWRQNDRWQALASALGHFEIEVQANTADTNWINTASAECQGI